VVLFNKTHRRIRANDLDDAEILVVIVANVELLIVIVDASSTAQVVLSQQSQSCVVERCHDDGDGCSRRGEFPRRPDELIKLGFVVDDECVNLVEPRVQRPRRQPRRRPGVDDEWLVSNTDVVVV
jgi:hypothetical protein